VFFSEQSGTTIAKVLNHTGGTMKYPYAILVLMILLAGCSTPLTTRGTVSGGASVGTMGSGVGDQGMENLKRDQDVESSRGRISD
jgi:hypothetical protein